MEVRPSTSIVSPTRATPRVRIVRFDVPQNGPRRPAIAASDPKPPRA